MQKFSRIGSPESPKLPILSAKVTPDKRSPGTGTFVHLLHHAQRNHLFVRRPALAIFTPKSMAAYCPESQYRRGRRAKDGSIRMAGSGLLAERQCRERRQPVLAHIVAADDLRQAGCKVAVGNGIELSSTPVALAQGRSDSPQ